MLRLKRRSWVPLGGDTDTKVEVTGNPKGTDTQAAAKGQERGADGGEAEGRTEKTARNPKTEARLRIRNSVH